MTKVLTLRFHGSFILRFHDNILILGLPGASLS